MIALQPFKITDFDTLISWIDNEESLVQFAGQLFSFPLTPQQLLTYIQDEKRFPYKVVSTLSGSTIGHAEIYLPGTGTAIFCRIIIGNPEYKGRGLCYKLIKALLEISFTELGAEKAELNVFDWNIPAIKCYERSGFIINPDKKKERVVNGKTWTALNMVADRFPYYNTK